MYFNHSYFLALRDKVLRRCLCSLSTGSHHHDDTLRIWCANVVKQVILPAKQRGESIHFLLNDAWAGCVVGIHGFTSLEIHVRILSRATDEGVIRREGALPVCSHQGVVD